MYVRPNFMSKEALKEAVAIDKTVTLYDPESKFGAYSQKEGIISVEGPYFEDPVTGKPCELIPEPRSWVAQVTLKEGQVVQVT